MASVTLREKASCSQTRLEMSVVVKPAESRGSCRVWIFTPRTTRSPILFLHYGPRAHTGLSPRHHHTLTPRRDSSATSSRDTALQEIQRSKRRQGRCGCPRSLDHENIA